MKFNFSIIFLILYLKSFSQLSEKVNNLYQKLTSNNTLESEFIGYSGMQSENYLNFKEISKIANDDEILYMAENGNEAIKSYMSSILVDRKSKNLSKLFLNYNNEDKEVHIRTGCMGYSSTIASELYRYVFYQKQKIDFINATNENHENVKEAEKEIYGDDYNEMYQTNWTKESVDSLLIIYNELAIANDKINPKFLNTIFRLNDFKFNNYKRVKYFALKYPTEEILATLASFKNRKDLKLFHNNSENSILAISIFPDTSFIPYLQKIEKENIENVNYYDAISAMCFDEIMKIKENIFTTLKNSNNIVDQEYLYYFEESLKKGNCDNNKLILEKIAEYNNR